MRSFILRFEEPCREDVNALGAHGTHTRTDAREESDQDVSAVATRTQTETRESGDQDRGSSSFRAIPSADCWNSPEMGTQTKTGTRESSDQDRSAELTGTETFTRTREQADQDATHWTYFAVPRPQ
jgi:hypothetical protein